jgi:hypothetical protein
MIKNLSPYKIFLLLGISFAINVHAQNNKITQTTKVKPFRPLIIGTDIFSPLNFRLEKIMGQRLSLSARFFTIYNNTLFHKKNGDFRSVSGELKYFLKPIENKPVNFYTAAYAKYRYADNLEALELSSPLKNTVTEPSRDNYYFGVLFGLKSFYHRFSIDYHLGIGVNKEKITDNYTGNHPLDYRANITLGYNFSDLFKGEY